MKKNNLFLMGCFLATSMFFMAGCSKGFTLDNDNQPDQQTHNVSFSVNPFNITYQPMAPSTNNGKTKTVMGGGGANVVNSGYLQKMWFLIYNAQGVLVSKTQQTYPQSGFGTFNTQLSSGNYTLCVAATNTIPSLDTLSTTRTHADTLPTGSTPSLLDSIIDSYISKNTNGFTPFIYGSPFRDITGNWVGMDDTFSERNFPTSLNSLYIGGSPNTADSSFIGDVFFVKQPIQIGNSDTVYNNISLNRLTGALQINLLDAQLPPTNIGVIIKNAPYRYQIATDSLQTSSKYNIDYRYFFSRDITVKVDSIYTNGGGLKVVVTPIAKSAFSYWSPFYCLGSNNTLTVVLTDATTNNPIKTIPNVYIYPNKKTILSGKLYDSTNISIPVSVDTSFAGTVLQNF